MGYFLRDWLTVAVVNISYLSSQMIRWKLVVVQSKVVSGSGYNELPGMRRTHFYSSNTTKLVIITTCKIRSQAQDILSYLPSVRAI